MNENASSKSLIPGGFEARSGAEKANKKSSL
jgi:hypothetical protein